MTKYQIALIGCGRIGKMHHDLIQSLDNVEIRYIVDDHLANDFPTSAEIVETKQLDTVLSDPTIKAVVIATPTSTHVSLIKKAAEYGKAIFCEKPVSLDIQELKEVKSILEKCQVKFQVGLNRRFDPDFSQIKKQIEEGQLGKVHMIKITNRDPKRPEMRFVKNSGGLFFDFNTHDFDMVNFLTDQKICQVYALGGALIEPELEKYNDIDTTIISLKLADGSLAVIDASRETNYGYDQRLEVFGEKGMLKVGNFNESNTVKISEKTNTETEAPYYDFVGRYKCAYLNELKAFFRYLSEDEKLSSPVGIDEMIESVRVAMSAQHSFQTNQPVTIGALDESDLP